MKILPEPLVFEWDRGNREKNQQKHGVTTREAEEIFVNEPRILFLDEKHSQDEKRYGMFGKTNEGKHLSVVFVIRGSAVRVITIRPMSKKERRAYEKIKADSSL